MTPIDFSSSETLSMSLVSFCRFWWSCSFSIFRSIIPAEIFSISLLCHSLVLAYPFLQGSEVWIWVLWSVKIMHEIILTWRFSKLPPFLKKCYQKKYYRCMLVGLTRSLFSCQQWTERLHCLTKRLKKITWQNKTRKTLTRNWITFTFICVMHLLSDSR